MLAIDLSYPSVFDPVTAEWWAQVKADGYEMAVIGLWGGRTANQEAGRWLRDAREAGLLIACYVAINGSRPGAEHIDIGVGFAEDEWDRCLFCAIDCEVDGIRLDHVASAVERVVALGLPAAIYTGDWWWRGKFGDPMFFAYLPLWSADYDDDPTLDFPLPYGGWPRLVGKQWNGTTQLYGVKVDLNTFDDGWVASLRAPAEATQTPQESLAALEAAFDALWRRHMGKTPRSRTILKLVTRYAPAEIAAVGEAWNAHKATLGPTN